MWRNSRINFCALYLSSLCKEVYLINRSEFRADKILQERVNRNAKIKPLTNQLLFKLIGDEFKLIGVNLISKDLQVSFLEIDGLFVSIGSESNSELFREQLRLDDSGFIISKDCTTNISGVFVAGDIRTKKISYCKCGWLYLC